MARLPDELIAQVCAPVRVESHHDDGVPASKWRGYDADGLLCWYRHYFSQWDCSFDDDTAPIVRLLRSEEFEAWRCLDRHWVRRVQRVVGPGGDEGQSHDSGFERVTAQQVPRL
jgi:hypothetical protein